jgi:hypothetical protein
LLGSGDDARISSNDYVHPALNQFGCQLGEALLAPLCPTILHDKVFALNPAQLAETLQEW